MWGATSDPIYGAAVAQDTKVAVNGTMAPQSIALAGGGQPHPNMSPFLVLNVCIALQGIFPSRN